MYEFAIAIETSGGHGSVAVVQADSVVDEAEFSQGFKHASGLLPLIDRLIRQRARRPRDVQAVFVSVGPGSFTGLRIGVTMAKTLSLATGAVVVPVPTLAVLARNAPAGVDRVVVALDAKRDEVFTATYQRRAGGWVEQLPARVTPLATAVAESGRPVAVLGEGVPFHEHILTDRTGVTVLGPEYATAHARHVAELGLTLSPVNPDRLVPTYVRRPEPEEKRLAAGGLGKSLSGRSDR